MDMDMDEEEEECHDKDELEVPVRKKYKYSIQLASALLESMQLTTTNNSEVEGQKIVEVNKHDKRDYDALRRKQVIQNCFPVSEPSSHERCLQDFVSTNSRPTPSRFENAMVVYQPSRFTQLMHLPSTEEIANEEIQPKEDATEEKDMMDLDDVENTGTEASNKPELKKRGRFAGAVSHGEWFY